MVKDKDKGKDKGIFSRIFRKKKQLEPLPNQSGSDGPGASVDTVPRSLPADRTINELPSRQGEQVPNLSGSDGTGVSVDNASPAEGTVNELPSQEGEQVLTLWEAAAKSLEPEDQKKLDVLIKSNRESQAADPSSKCQGQGSSPDGDGGDSLTHDVNHILSGAKKLKDQDKNATWRPVSSTPSQNPYEMHP
jgi:hypothetical protein